MRKLLPLFILLLAFVNSFACSCKSRDFMNRFQTSKFIAKAKILSFADDKADRDYYIAKIQVLELFKGSKISTIKVEQNGCPLFMDKNTIWLIFAEEQKGKYFAINDCSGCSQIEQKVDSTTQTDRFFEQLTDRRLAMLRYLKSRKIQNGNPDYLEFGYSADRAKTFKGYKSKKTFAVYEIEVSKNLSVKTIKALATFDNKELSRKILNWMRENLKVGKRDLKAISKPTKLLIGFYYFPAENGKKSVVSLSDEISYQ